MNKLMTAIAAFENAPATPVKNRLALARMVLRALSAPDLPKPLPPAVQSAVNAARAYSIRHDDPAR